MVGGKGGRGYECRLIGGVGLYACHDEVIDIHSGKEGFMGPPLGTSLFLIRTQGGTCVGLPISQGSVIFTWDIVAFASGKISAVSTVAFRWECAAASAMTP